MTRSIAPYALAAGVLAASTLAGCGTAPAHTNDPVTHARGSTSPPVSIAQAGLPEFFVDTVNTLEGNGALEVRDSATGRLEAQDNHAFGVTALAVTGARSFVIAAPAGGNSRCATRLYRLNLTSHGRPGRLSPLGQQLRGRVWSLTASAHGHVIGYTVSGCAKGQPGYLRVLNTRTGRTREWGDVSLGGVSPGNVAVSGPSLSISADGRLLAFAGWDVAGNWRAIGYGRFTRQVVRTLLTSAAAGTLAQRSHVVLTRPVSQPSLAAVALSPGGQSFYLCTMSSNRTGSVRKIAAYATSTGATGQVIATVTGTSVPATCQMALDPTGRFLLLTYSLNNPHYPRTQVLRLARIDLTTRSVATLTIKLPPNAGMNSYAGMTAAW